MPCVYRFSAGSVASSGFPLALADLADLLDCRRASSGFPLVVTRLAASRRLSRGLRLSRWLSRVDSGFPAGCGIECVRVFTVYTNVLSHTYLHVWLNRWYALIVIRW